MGKVFVFGMLGVILSHVRRQHPGHDLFHQVTRQEGIVAWAIILRPWLIMIIAGAAFLLQRRK